MDNMKTMKKYLLPAFMITITAIMGSCSKSYTPTVGPYSNLEFAVATITSAAETTFVDASKGGTYYGKSGSRFIIPQNAFQTSGGGAVTGTIGIISAEFLTKTDMMFSGIFPYNPSNNLATAGEVYINALDQNLNTLNFTTDLRYTINIPQAGTPPEGLSFFVGGQIPSSKDVAWSADLDSNVGSITYMLGHNADTISITSNKTGFVAADKSIDDPKTHYPTFSVTPVIPGVTLSDTVAAFAVYDGYNSMWLMQNVNSNHIFTESQVRPIPLHFVLMTVVNGYFYAGILAVPQLTNNANYQVTLTQIAPSDFKTMVGNLP